jgi:septum site-determining protein MinC
MAEALEFKSSQLSLTLVRVHDANMTTVGSLLESKLAKAGKFLKGAPVVVDPIATLTSVQLAQLLELLRQYQMTPVGVRTSDAHLVDYAEMCGLAVFKPSSANNSVAKQAPAASEKPEAEVTTKPVKANESATVKAIRIANLRSGQLEKHMQSDVIIEGSLNSGAELFVGGNITVLGSVRGRIHAGAGGDRDARIIARNFNPELVSIAGVFLLADDIPALAKQGWVEVYLLQNSLKFQSLD